MKAYWILYDNKYLVLYIAENEETVHFVATQNAKVHSCAFDLLSEERAMSFLNGRGHKYEGTIQYVKAHELRSTHYLFSQDIEEQPGPFDDIKDHDILEEDNWANAPTPYDP